MVLLHADWIFEGDIEPLHFMASGATKQQCLENLELAVKHSPQYPNIRVENVRIEGTEDAKPRQVPDQS